MVTVNIALPINCLSACSLTKKVNYAVMNKPCRWLLLYGRANVRSALYMGTLVATRYSPVIKEFYDRLREAGKPAKMAIVVCMRKLMTILNSMIKYQRTWQAIDFVSAS